MNNRIFIGKQQTASTNEDAKLLIKQSAFPCFAVVQADRQTQGKGRLGRDFYSPDGGLYFSVTYPLLSKTDNIPFLTLLSGVCVANTLDEICHTDTQIKWPNDIYIDGKKVCGILTELVSNGEMLTAVVGIGINLCLTQNEIPTQLKTKMTSLKTLGYAPPEKQMLMQKIIHAADRAVYADNGLALPDENLLNTLNKKSFLKGKTVSFTQNGKQQCGTADCINKDGSLRVILQDNEIFDVKYGEVLLSQHHENTVSMIRSHAKGE